MATWPQVHELAAQAVRAAQAIAAQPHHTLLRHAAARPLHELTRIEPGALAEALRGPLDQLADEPLPTLQAALRPASQRRGGPVPQRMRSTAEQTTLDCAEHRLLRALLERLRWRVQLLAAVVHAERRRAPSATLAQWQSEQLADLRRLRRCLALAPLAVMATPLTAPTHLMRHDQRYRRVWQLWRALREQPALACHSPWFHLPLADLATLYERWCLLQVVAAALPLGTVATQQLFAYADDRRLPWALKRLAENAPLLVLNLPDGGALQVIYQRRYGARLGLGPQLGSLDPFVRVPDIALEIERPGQAPRTLLLDAKYRATPAGAVPQPALDTAYTYHGAIGFAGARATLGAWLLFPGSQTLRAGAVGALPLLPGATAALAALLRDVL